MALITSVAGITTANRNVISYNKSDRNLRDAGETFYNLVETIESEVCEWVALDEATAKAAVTAETGESLMSVLTPATGVTYEHTQDEDVRTIGSYRYTCSAEKKTIAFA